MHSQLQKLNIWQLLMQVNKLYDLHILCLDVGFVHKYVRLDCDSQSAIFLPKNPVYHAKTKDIDVQYHFVKDMVEDKKVLLEKVDTLKNVADSLMKYVSTEKLSWCREYMGIDAPNL